MGCSGTKLKQDKETVLNYRIVFVRHGESTWNRENRFTGWTDVDLSETGIEESFKAGEKLKEKNFSFDICFTSMLQRAQKTWKNIAEKLNENNIPIVKTWQLNERHYGALQGLNKSETAQQHGEEQVKIWRRAYDISPPALEKTDERYPGNDPMYKDVPSDSLPTTECLKDTVARVLPIWNGQISSAIKSGKKVIVCAHGNSLRAIIKHLDSVSEKDILELNIPTALPLVYELDNNLKPIKHYYLATDEEVNEKINAVANQGKAK